MKQPLSEQVVVISGASSGIGRATAQAAGRRGARVVVSARNEEALANAVTEIEAHGGEALAVPGDASSGEDAEALNESLLRAITPSHENESKGGLQRTRNLPHPSRLARQAGFFVNFAK